MSSSSSDEAQDPSPAERRWGRYLCKLWTERAKEPDYIPIGSHFFLTLQPRLCPKCVGEFRGLLGVPPALPVVTPD